MLIELHSHQPRPLLLERKDVGNNGPNQVSDVHMGDHISEVVE